MRRILILLGWRILAWFGTSGKVVKDNEAANREVLNKQKLWPQGGYIEKQSELGDLKFGASYTMAYGGCGLIALYNTLVAFGKAPSYEVFLELAKSLQKRGVAWGGKYGIHPVFIRKWLKRRGYLVKRIPVTEESFDQNESDYKVFVVTVINGNELKNMVHTVCITKNESGFTVHNGSYRTAYPTLAKAVANSSWRGAKAIYALGVGDVPKAE